MVLACGSPEIPSFKGSPPISKSVFAPLSRGVLRLLSHTTVTAGLRVVQEDPADRVMSGCTAEFVIYTYFSPVLCTSKNLKS